MAILPCITGGLHYLYLNNYLQQWTLFLDLSNQSNNKNFQVAFEYLLFFINRGCQSTLLTNKELEQYISQETSVANSNHLQLENPKFAPYSFDLHGITGKVDEDRTRYSFECNFKDMIKGTVGRVNSLILFHRNGSSEYEKFVVHIEQPVQLDIVLQEFDDTKAPSSEDNYAQFNQPKKGYAEERP